MIISGHPRAAETLEKSRAADLIDSHASPFDFAKATSRVASSAVKTSVATSCTPATEVTATAFGPHRRRARTRS